MTKRASFFNRIARDAGLPFLGVAAAAEEPYDTVPQPVADFLEHEGLPVRAFKPHRVQGADLRAAAKIVAIDCAPPPAALPGCVVERWDDVPKVSVDLAASAAAIRRHVETLAAIL